MSDIDTYSNAATSSHEGDNTSKRKQLTESESYDSSFSPKLKKYKFRSTTTSGCVFGGGKALHNCGSSSSTSTIRGPSTSTWGVVHTNRLNFKRDTHCVHFTTLSNLLNEHFETLIQFLFEGLKSNDGTELAAPEIVNTDITKELRELYTTGEMDPILQYMDALVVDMRKNDIDVSRVTEQGLPAFRDYYIKLTERVYQQKSSAVRPSNLTDGTIFQFVKSFAHMYVIFGSNTVTEQALDQHVYNLMLLIQDNERWHFKFAISKRDESRVHFDICGTQVTSDTNILWEYTELPTHYVSESYRFPVVLSENKSQIPERVKVGKPTGYYPSKKSPSHRKLTQVIGQCVSMAEKSPFETKDYKIVYHVSLMGTSELVITRTHIAKSTLKVIKEGCEIPNEDELDPSYVFEFTSKFENVTHAFFHVYTPLLLLGKVTHMSFYVGASVKEKTATSESVGGKLKRVFKRKSSRKSSPPKKK